MHVTTKSTEGVPGTREDFLRVENLIITTSLNTFTHDVCHEFVVGSERTRELQVEQRICIADVLQRLIQSERLCSAQVMYL
jgi:hypothetical protein